MENKLRPKYSAYKLNMRGQDTVGTRMLSTNPDDVDSPFTLMPRKDPAAFAALITYARYCEPSLAIEIKAWLYKIVEAEPVFGTQGTRNLKAARLRALQDTS